jgi:hypothetical protein
MRRGWRFALALLAGGLASVCALASAAQPAASQEVVDDVLDGLIEWRRIESVLTHPRCLNCHTMTDHPTQGDERRPHVLDVGRGADGRGTGSKCQTCHREDNQPAMGIPGAQDWRMAPLAFAWEKAPGEPASGAAICASLKAAGDEDGQPDFERLIEYIQLADFVQWAWEPGKRQDGAERSRPPMSHETFVGSVKRWISAGAPCPPPAPMPGSEVTAATPSP